MYASSTIFLRLWNDSTWDWTPVSQGIGEHSTHKISEPVNCIKHWQITCFVIRYSVNLSGSEWKLTLFTREGIKSKV